MKFDRMKSKHLSGDDRKPLKRILLANGWHQSALPERTPTTRWVDPASQQPLWSHPTRREKYTLLNALRINERMERAT